MIGVILVFILLVGGIVFFLFSFKKDREDTLKRMEDVKVEYKSFSDCVDEFNDRRNELYLNEFDNIYFDTMGERDNEVRVKLTQYEQSVDKITEAVSSLSKLCGNIYFTDKSVNNKCSSFGSVYEQIYNAFVYDINFYNENILKYNEYQSEMENPNLLKEFKSDKKFIDYNGDKKFEGKEG